VRSQASQTKVPVCVGLVSHLIIVEADQARYNSKFLDSHLRPYTCTHAATNKDCEDLRFSSNACLFRHQREAHGMHNHGMHPYLCDFPDCERAKPGNGFPRRWNRRDHMKRVHGYDSDADSRTSRHGPVRKHKNKFSSVPMSRSSSARSLPYSKHRPDVIVHPTQMMYPPMEYPVPFIVDQNYMLDPCFVQYPGQEY
jgi:hypothetical protein